MRAKTRYVKGCKFNQKCEYKRNEDDTVLKNEPLFVYKYKRGDVCYEDKVYVMGVNSLKQQFKRVSQDGHRQGVLARVLPVLLVRLHFCQIKGVAIQSEEGTADVLITSTSPVI